MNKTQFENWEKLKRVFNRIAARFGEAVAQEIFIIIREESDDKITFSFEHYEREERNRQIQDDFHGGNYGELAVRYGLSAKQVKRIVATAYKRYEKKGK